MRPSAFLVALLSLAAPLSAHAGEVSGTVYDQRGRPAAGVELVLGGAAVVSGADGAFTFGDVAAGEHTIAAGNQRVAVSVADEGSVRRNLFLLGQTARAMVTGETATTPENDAALAASFRLAQALLDESAAQGGVAWRWNDLDG